MIRPDPERRPRDRSAPGRTVAPYLVPAVPEVTALLDAAERVLAACERAEDAHADRALRMAAAVDPSTLPLTALVGPGLPVPLARRIAARALRRLGSTVRSALPRDPARWTAPGRVDLVAFRPLRVDTTDLALLGQAAAQLTHPRRTREGTLGGAIESLCTVGSREPGEDRHPAALGCLLAVVVPVVDPVALTVYEAASTESPVLDTTTRDAHRELGHRVVSRLGALTRS